MDKIHKLGIHKLYKLSGRIRNVNFFFLRLKKVTFMMSQVLCNLLSNTIFGDKVNAAFGAFESESRKEYIGWVFCFVLYFL